MKVKSPSRRFVLFGPSFLSKATIFLLGTSLGLIFMRTWDASTFLRQNSGNIFLPNTSSIIMSSRQSLADGCYHVFLDVGANIGVHGRFLFEPQQYPDAHRARDIFDAQWGNRRDNRDICVFAFEPNPAHAAKLKANSEAYAALGWRYHVVNQAAGDRAGSLTFYHNGDEEFGEWAFGVKKWHDGAQSVSVPVIRLVDWVEQHIVHRAIPSATYGNYEGGPKVVMKMDVEGTEFVLLPDLIFSGKICSVDFVFGEFHEGAAPLEFPGQDFSLGDVEQTTQLRTSLLDVIRSPRNCRTVFSLGDDESYLHDGIPLPTAAAQNA